MPFVCADLETCRCEPHVQTPLRVAVLLSGGVDSSLTLHLLKEAGHSVTAFYLQVWFQEDFENFWSSCPWEEDLAVCKEVRTAMRVVFWYLQLLLCTSVAPHDMARRCA